MWWNNFLINITFIVHFLIYCVLDIHGAIYIILLTYFAISNSLLQMRKMRKYMIDVRLIERAFDYLLLIVHCRIIVVKACATLCSWNIQQMGKLQYVV